MRKIMFFVMVLVFANTHIAKAAPPIGNDEGQATGLLKKSGSIDEQTAKDILHAFVDYSNKKEEGQSESDVQFLRQYIRTDIKGYNLDKIRILVLDRLTKAAGKDPRSEQIDAEQAHEIIDQLTVKRISQSFWKQTGNRSVRIHMDGSGISTWIPNRSQEDILMFGDEAVFSLYCLNPLLIPKTDQPVVQNGNDDEEYEEEEEDLAPRRRASRNSGGNSAVATNNNNVHIYMETPQSQPIQVADDGGRRRSGFGTFIAGVGTGIVGTVLYNNLRGPRYYRGNDFGYRYRNNNDRYDRYSYRRTSYRHRDYDFRTPTRRYNTNSLSGIVPGNGRPVRYR